MWAASYLWAKSLLLLPMAMTFALEFTTPAWTLLLAAPILGERITRSRIGAVVLGLIGILVILRPGIATFQPARAASLDGGVRICGHDHHDQEADAHRHAVRDHLLDEADPVAAGHDRLRSTVRDQTPSAQIPAVIGVGLSGLTSHYCLTNAFRAGDASVVVPLDFMRIPLIAVIGWWLYDEPLDVFVFLGAGLIITGILWNLRSEARRFNDPAKPVSGTPGSPR